MLTLRRHLQSQWLAEKLVPTQKCSTKSVNSTTIQEHEPGVDSFLPRRRNATTWESLAQLFRSRISPPNLRCLESTDVVYRRGGDLGLASMFLLGPSGNRMAKILDMDDSLVHRRHIDQIHNHVPDTNPTLLIMV